MGLCGRGELVERKDKLESREIGTVLGKIALHGSHCICVIPRCQPVRRAGWQWGHSGVLTGEE